MHDIVTFMFFRVEPANEYYDGDKDNDKEDIVVNSTTRPRTPQK